MLKDAIASLPTILLVILLLMFSKISGLTSVVDLKIYDNLLKVRQAQAPDDITIIAIDEKSIATFGRWPWPRDVHVQLLEQLKNYNPQLIAFDVLFTEEDVNASIDRSFVSAVKNLGNVVLPVYLSGSSYIDTNKIIHQKYPFPDLAAEVSGFGHVQVNPDVDGIVRSVYLHQGVQRGNENPDLDWLPHFSLMALRFLKAEIETDKEYKFRYLESKQQSRLIKKDNSYIPYIGPAGSFNTVSYLDVVLGRVSSQKLKDKIIFIGAIAVGLGDSVVTPLTKDGRNLSGVEMNANIFEALRSDKLVTKISLDTSFYVALFICALLVLLGTLYSVKKLLLVLLGIGLGVTGISYFLLAHFNIWLPSAALLIGLIFIYPVWSFFRLSQAFSFLKSEVLKAENTPAIFSEPEKIIDIQAQLNSLLKTEKITGWLINQPEHENLIMGGQFSNNIDSSLTDKGFVNVDNFSYEWMVAWKNSSFKLAFRDRLSSALNIKNVLNKNALPKELISTQIEQLKEANKQVRGMYGMTRDTLNNMQSMMFVFDSLGRILYSHGDLVVQNLLVDVAAEERHIFSYVERIFHGAQEISSDLNKLMFEDELIYKEFEAVDDRYFLMQANLVTGLMHGGTYLMMLTDISEMKRLQKSREEALQFLSHDLRSPIVSIMSLLERMRLQRDDSGGVEKGLIDECSDVAGKSLEFANNYLQLVRAEEDDFEFDLVDAEGVFETAIAGVYPQAKFQGISITRHWPKDIIWVSANVNLLNRALQNLLSNAIKYSDESREIEVGLKLDLEVGMVGFSVKDYGIGIPQEHLTHLFERFKRASNALSSSIEGTGLGLRFVHVVSKRLSGFVEVQSNLNKGSEFILWLPNIKESVE